MIQKQNRWTIYRTLNMISMWIGYTHKGVIKKSKEIMKDSIGSQVVAGEEIWRKRKRSNKLLSSTDKIWARLIDRGVLSWTHPRLVDRHLLLILVKYKRVTSMMRCKLVWVDQQDEGKSTGRETMSPNRWLNLQWEQPQDFFQPSEAIWSMVTIHW